MTAFDDAFTRLIGNEGGYSNNPADPGGETMYGVTKRVAEKHGYTGDMKLLPLDTAKAIAKAEYWDVHRCDEFDPHVAFQVFDAAYNGGHPAQWLQTAAGVAQDGVIGPATVAAVQAADPARIVARFDAQRLLYLTELSDWPSFARGWVRRVANNLLYGES